MAMTQEQSNSINEKSSRPSLQPICGVPFLEAAQSSTAADVCEEHRPAPKLPLEIVCARGLSIKTPICPLF